MGAGLEMTRKKTACLVGLLGLLAGCGNDQTAQESLSRLPKGKALGAMVTAIFVKPQPFRADPAAVATVRGALEKAGQPVLLVTVPSRGADLFAPYGQNGPVITWATSAQQSIALDDGLLVATRGFGPDLMSASVPSLAQVSRATGTSHRDYYDLDGADQNRHFAYDCTLAPAGMEAVEVFGATYPTRKVTESCAGPDASFVNIYWFDADGRLRQSDQHATPGLPTVQIGRVVD